MSKAAENARDAASMLWNREMQLQDFDRDVWAALTPLWKNPEKRKVFAEGDAFQIEQWLLKPLWANSEKRSSLNFEIPNSANQYVACVLYHFRLPRSESVLGFTDPGNLGFGMLLVSVGLFKVLLFTAGSFPTPPPPMPPRSKHVPVRILRGDGGI